MTHYQFGAVAGDESTGGVFDMGQVVLYREHTTVAVQTVREGQSLPVIALQLSGRINKSDDTLQAVYLFSLMDAGSIVAALADAATRISDEAIQDFKAGMAEGMK